MMNLLKQASEGSVPWYRNVEDEIAFTRRYYRRLLEGEGVRENVETRADMLFDALWCSSSILRHETEEVLRYFRSHGYKMGVISDTAPSLQLSLERLGIGQYFTLFTASSLVGAGKPNPVIYNAAFAAQGVAASESLYVDDYDVETDGARVLGFTSFHLDKTGKASGEWVISDLREIVAFAEKG